MTEKRYKMVIPVVRKTVTHPPVSNDQWPRQETNVHHITSQPTLNTKHQRIDRMPVLISEGCICESFPELGGPHAPLEAVTKISALLACLGLGLILTSMHGLCDESHTGTLVKCRGRAECGHCSAYDPKP